LQRLLQERKPPPPADHHDRDEAQTKPSLFCRHGSLLDWRAWYDVLLRMVWGASQACRLGIIGSFAFVMACTEILGDDFFIRSGEGGGGGAGGTLAPGTFAFALESSQVDVVQNADAELAVTVTRGAGHTADVAVTVVGLPTGIAAAPLTVPGADTQGSLTLTAASDAEAGASTGVDVIADDGTSQQTVALEISVRAAPGSVDESFGLDGISVATLPTSDFREARGIIVLEDDSILLGSTADGASDSSAAVVRFEAEGDIDSTFGNDGFYVHDGGGDNTTTADLALSGSDIVLTGDAADASFVAMLVPGGTPHPDFTPPSPEDIFPQLFSGVAVSTGVNTSILCAGVIISNPALQRVTLDGVLDNSTSLGPTGGFQFAFWDNLRTLFVMGGSCNDEACLARADVLADPVDWGAAVHRPFGPGNLTAGLADADGRYYATGNDSGWKLARFIPAGLAQSGEDEFPYVVDDIAAGSEWAGALALRDSYLYVAGTVEDVAASEHHPAIARYSLAGERDQSFGEGGIVMFDSVVVPSAAGVEVGIQSNGRIIVAMANEDGALLVYRLWD
jgi:hypothetical protein